MISYGLYIWYPFVPEAYLRAVSALGLEGRIFGVHYIRYPLLAALLLLAIFGSYCVLERLIRNFR